MPDVTIVYWATSPPQVIVGSRPPGNKVQLSETLRQAIDRAA
jgi:hypothetical protein